MAEAAAPQVLPIGLWQIGDYVHRERDNSVTVDFELAPLDGLSEGAPDFAWFFVDCCPN